MSADNWEICPRCEYRRNDSIKKVETCYGVLEAKEYNKALKEAEIVLQPTFREDYEIGINQGEFFVSYSGECTKCGFSFKYKHTKKVMPE